MADTASAQGMNTNLTHVVSQDPANVFSFIAKTLEAHHKLSTSLVCGIAQLFIVRTFHGDDAQRWPAVKTRDWLKAQLNERGLKQAMVYRYIATGQEIARLIQKKYVWGGVMHDILAADNEMKGYNAIYRCVMDHGYLIGEPTLQWGMDSDGKPRFSLDVLRVNLGLDKLDPAMQKGYVPPSLSDILSSTTPDVPATKASPASVVSRVKADPEVLKDIPIETMAGAIEKVIGRETMAERLISLCSLEECLKLQTVLNERMKTLAAAPMEEPVKTEVPANELATIEPVTETETVSSRKRGSKRKAA